MYRAICHDNRRNPYRHAMQHPVGDILLSRLQRDHCLGARVVDLTDQRERGPVVFEYDCRTGYRRTLAHRLRNLEFRIDVAIDFEKLASFSQGLEKATEILKWHRGCTPGVIRRQDRLCFSAGPMLTAADR